jgi:hypothetical protein
MHQGGCWRGWDAAVNHPEDDIQRAVAQRLDALGVLWCHTPNGGKRGRVEAARLNGLGVKPGVPDVLIYDPPPNSPSAKGAALELKAPKGKPSESQIVWLTKLAARGWETDIAYGLDEAHAILDAWGYGNVNARTRSMRCASGSRGLG